MAPVIQTTIKFLAGAAQMSIPDKPSKPCVQTHSNVGKGPSLLSPTISTISWGFNRMDVYAADKVSGGVAHKWWDGYQWGPGVADMEIFEGSSGFPSAVSGNSDKMDIFVPTSDGSLQHKYWDGNTWNPSFTGWENLKGKVDLDYAPATTSWAPGRLDAFFKGTDKGLYLVYYDGSNWGPSGSDNEDLGGKLASGPAAVSWGPNRNDIFVIDSNNSLSHKYWDGNNWSGWQPFDLDQEFTEDTPRAVSWGVNRLDVFLTNTGGTVSHIYWDGYQWSALEDLGGKSLVGTVAVTASLNRLNLVALGEDSLYYYKFYDGSAVVIDQDDIAWIIDL
ncbi:MAG: hypothetical protein Q9170_003124 [Blastenia crenularia]